MHLVKVIYKLFSKTQINENTIKDEKIIEDTNIEVRKIEYICFICGDINNKALEFDSICINCKSEFENIGNEKYIFSKNNLYGIINGKGKVILEPDYDMVNDRFFYYGETKYKYFLIKKNNLFGIVKLSGFDKINIIPPQYDSIKPCASSVLGVNEYFLVSKNKEYKIVTDNNFTIIEINKKLGKTTICNSCSDSMNIEDIEIIRLNGLDVVKKPISSYCISCATQLSNICQSCEKYKYYYHDYEPKGNGEDIPLLCNCHLQYNYCRKCNSHFISSGECECIITLAGR